MEGVWGEIFGHCVNDPVCICTNFHWHFQIASAIEVLHEPLHNFLFYCWKKARKWPTNVSEFILKILNQLYLIDINKELIWLVKKWYTYNQSIRRKYGIILNYSMYYIEDITLMAIRRKYGIILNYSMFYIKDIT